MMSQETASPVNGQENARGPSRATSFVKSGIAVLGGFLAAGVCGVIRDGVIDPGAGGNAPPAALVTATWLLGFLIGGYVAAAIAGRREGRHAFALGVTQFITGVALKLTLGPHRIPELLSILHMAIPLPVVGAGGLFRAWEKTRGLGGSPTSRGAAGSLMLLSSLVFLGLTTADYENPSPLAFGIAASTFIGACLAFGGRFLKFVSAILLLGVGAVVVIWLLASLHVAEMRLSPLFGGAALLLNLIAIWALSRRAGDSHHKAA